MEKIRDFYNRFDKKLIKDYLESNQRMESAIINLSRFIPIDSKNILDIGCGIGWSSHEFAGYFQEASVKGIDLSPNLIATAGKLFERNNLSYQVFDITADLPSQNFDAVVMIDVYEHIPKEERSNFHLALKKLFKHSGRLLLACPSKFHQEFLKQNNPEGLQPVDEDLDFKDIALLANDIGGEVIYFKYQKIWNTYDYFYSVIEINPVYGPNNSIESKGLNLEIIESRKERVKEKLNLQFSNTKPKDPGKLKSLLRKGYNRLKK